MVGIGEKTSERSIRASECSRVYGGNGRVGWLGREGMGGRRYTSSLPSHFLPVYGTEKEDNQPNAFYLMEAEK